MGNSSQQYPQQSSNTGALNNPAAAGILGL
jgi:hypothetical protein